MKYYIYISDAKLDMLYPQIPKPILKKIASSLSIDLKFLGAELSVGAKGGPYEETRYAKVQIVSEYIEKHLDVGSVDAPSTYFKGSLLMHWGPIKIPSKDIEEEQVVFFGGLTNRTLVALNGSMYHVIGNFLGTRVIPAIGYSNMPAFYWILKIIAMANSDAERIIDPIRQDKKLLDLVEETIKKMQGPKQHVEFLAKTLLQGQSVMKDYVVLGTPIYVAIAD